MGSLNPFALLMGGGSLFTLSAMIWGLKKVPLWLRYPGMALCVALGLTAFAIAIMRGFQRKAPPPRYTSKKAPPVALPPEVAARTSASPRATKAGARAKSPRRTPPPNAT